MDFTITINELDGTPLATRDITWTLKRQPPVSGDPDVEVETGSAPTDGKGVLKFTSALVQRSDRVHLVAGDLKCDFGVINTTRPLSKTVAVEKARKAGELKAGLSEGYDITQNDRADWDWLIWETEGNSDPKYQRGGKERKLGLYTLDYDKLRKAGGKQWAEKHHDGTLGGGWVKIGVLDQLDYTKHLELMNTFLPCFKVQEGLSWGASEELIRTKSGVMSRSPSCGQGINTLNTPPPLILMPFNYDDNSSASRAIGCSLADDRLSKADAKRLNLELPRWATASRSTITAFSAGRLDLSAHAKQQWDLRPTTAGDSNLPQVKGPAGAKAFLVYQTDVANKDKRYYSVKTGVDFVATQSQKTNNKDLLESNSIHAMSRSNIIAGTLKRVGEGNFEAVYQIEILCILLGKQGSWDGIQIREIGNGGQDAVWFPALAIPSHGKAFAEAWKPGCDWVEFWRDNFARPLGRAKGEMMAFFGMQHMTSNAQNFLVAFDRKSPPSDSTYTILRDIGDTILHTVFFDILKTIDPLFQTAWEHEVADKDNGIVLAQGQKRKDLKIGGGYANPQITRLGTGIVFFFGPFLKGDVDTAADPKKVKIIAQWCLASNLGFFDYMKESLGYQDTWPSGQDAVEAAIAGRVVPVEQVTKNAAGDELLVVTCDDGQKLCAVLKFEPPPPPEPPDPDKPEPLPEPTYAAYNVGDLVTLVAARRIPPESLAALKLTPQILGSPRHCVEVRGVIKSLEQPELENSVRRNADLSLSGQNPEYATLAANVLSLSSRSRLNLLQRIEAEIIAADPKTKKDVDDMQRLVAGHELLICAEIHNYIQTAAGKKALVNLHKGGAKPGPVQRGPVTPVCYTCKTPQPPSAVRWLQCGTCGSLFCPNCAAKLEYPRGTSPSMRSITTDRACGADSCKGYAEPVK